MNTIKEQETTTVLAMGEKITSLEKEIAQLKEIIQNQKELIKELS